MRRYNSAVPRFRDKLLATVKALLPALGKDGWIVGSEVPNLHLLARRPRARGLFVSEDVDVAFSRRATAHRIRRLPGWKAAPQQPSVLLPKDASRHIEINLLRLDPDLPLDEAAVDREGGFVAFGTLNLLRPERIRIGGFYLPVASLASIAVEKLATARSGPKGLRDLEVAFLAIRLLDAEGRKEVAREVRALPEEFRRHAAANAAALYAEAAAGRRRASEREREALRALLDEEDL